MTIPCGTDGSGLPIGLQLTAPALGEVTLFRVGAALEAELEVDLRPNL
jgi:aspartyl-tRNA(Asn)/glutamyl-tRNA(Gln) amidotransferase subunit A